MSLCVEFDDAAQKELAELPGEIQRRILERIIALADDSYPPNTKELAGNLRGLRSMRVGDYRIAYQVDEEAGLVVVLGMGHRSRFYNRIARRLM